MSSTPEPTNVTIVKNVFADIIEFRIWRGGYHRGLSRSTLHPKKNDLRAVRYRLRREDDVRIETDTGVCQQPPEAGRS